MFSDWISGFTAMVHVHPNQRGKRILIALFGLLVLYWPITVIEELYRLAGKLEKWYERTGRRWLQK